MPRNEAVAIGSCRTIFTAQQVFRDVGNPRRYLGTDRDEYSPDLLDLYDPGRLGERLNGTLSDDELARTARKSGYMFGSAQGVGDGDCTRGGAITSLRYQWEIYASPTEPGVTGSRWFWVSEAGVIMATTDPGAPPARGDTSGVWVPID